MSADRAVLLTPGAGTDAAHASLVRIEGELAPIEVERMDFPYRREGRKGPPDRAPKLIAAVREGAAELAERSGLAPDRLVLGGRSMGGRMCSMAIAEGLPALGLVVIAYPLHPPKRPERLRIEHLPEVDVPTLAISGTKDPFGTPDELEHHLSAIAGPLTMHLLDGKRHDLRGADDEIARLVADWVASLPSGTPGAQLSSGER
jgi:predicted alpha/beta-hydrolase family hydrolase